METTLNDILKVWFSDDKISIETKNGVVKSHPLRWFSRLKKATIEQRNNFELSHFSPIHSIFIRFIARSAAVFESAGFGAGYSAGSICICF